jgi:methyl-accepting chemotaxis protein
MSQERTGLFSRFFGKSDPGVAGRGPIETVSLWRAFETIQTQVRSVHEGSGALVPKLVRQASLSEGAIDRVRAGRTRSRELREGISRVSQVLERIEIVALNASLEAARLGDSRGLPLTLIADEVKGHVLRGLAGVEDLATAVDETERELGRCETQIELASTVAGEAGQQAARIQDGARIAFDAVEDFATKLRVATGSDAETSEALAAAVDHARSLADALSKLAGRVPRALLVAALRPVLEPLFGLVDDDARDEGA